MSMLKKYLTISESNIDLVKGDGLLILRFLEPEDPDAYLEALSNKDGMHSDVVGTVPDLELLPAEQYEFDLEWDLLLMYHMVYGNLNGFNESPFAFLMSPGDHIDNVDYGWVAPTIATSKAVQDCFAALSSIDPESDFKYFDQDVLLSDKVISKHYAQSDKENLILDYICYFDDLMDFLKFTTANDFGLVCTVT